ncbi:cyclin-like protein [Astrocystis sublimbata]|nr:cyclin-like protein [Astrocystis sublimbata]
MASIERYRPLPREGYQPPIIASSTTATNNRIDIDIDTDTATAAPTSRRRPVPPPVPSPPTHSSRTSPPRPHSRRSNSSPASPSPSSPSPVPSALSAMASQWFFTQDEVLSSPSVLDGLPPAEERLRRAKGVNFIYQAGILLELPQITLYVAGVFFHRFYMRRSMVEEKQGIHHYNIAATALFLANKTEENCRKTKEIIIAVAKVAQKNPKLIVDEQSKEYWRWRDSILMYEEVMLECLTFHVMVDNPHFKLYEFLGQVNLVHNKTLRHAAWAFCNDSCLTVLPLLMEARDIAIASIFFASTFTGDRVKDQNGEPWWQALKANEEHCLRAIDVLKEFYVENPLRKSENPYSGSPSFILENTRRNGDEAGSSNHASSGTEYGETQSPKIKVNGMGEDAAQREIDTAAAESASQTAPGDSDVALKEAANNLTVHSSTNGDGMTSPSKRKGMESLASEAREEKRQRLSSDDEGEVHE